jgi:hypothetical protein
MTPALRLRLREHSDKIELDARDQALRRLFRQLSEVMGPYGFRLANVSDWSSMLQVTLAGGAGWVVRHQAGATRVVFVHWDRYRPGLTLQLCDDLLNVVAGTERNADLRYDPGVNQWIDVDGADAVEFLAHLVLDMLNGEGAPRR